MKGPIVRCRKCGAGAAYQTEVRVTEGTDTHETDETTYLCHSCTRLLYEFLKAKPA